MQTEKTTCISFLPTARQTLVLISFNLFFVALDPLDKPYESAGEQSQDDNSITGQTNQALHRTDNKWDDNYRLLDELGNLKVMTCLSRFTLLSLLLLLCHVCLT